MKVFKIAMLVFVASLAAYAFTPQDPMAVGRGMYFMKLNNDRVRVMVVKFAPGQSIGMHRHPDHVVYAIQGGRLQVDEEGKDRVTMNIPTGAVVWLPAQAHQGKNVGKTQIKLLVTELK